VAVLVGLAILISISAWVWQDARKRGMNPRWAIGVGLAMIIFLPLYFALRKPVKCIECGTNIDSSSRRCASCEERVASESDIRSGRIFG